jgi:DNA invertase Pin-like site-specific DNA recombinase
MSPHYVDRAALYVRASTQHQNYSTQHQVATLHEYAVKHGLEVVTIYRDEGRSGLHIDDRSGLLRLLEDVNRGRANFSTVLVYDVSRWGRFQDSDQSAYYEFACRRAGISVVYCEEPLLNDGSPMAAMLKSLKRAMAAEFSRELSTKVFRAQCRLTLAGFKQGGVAGYGLRRMAVTTSGEHRNLLALRQRKSNPTDRVTYVRGTQDEVAVIQWIYAMYIDEHMYDTAIAGRLNAEGLKNACGRSWSSHNVKQILTNEKYAGTLVFNRSTQRLRSARRPNDQDKWIRQENAFDAIVSRDRFAAARAERKRRNRIWSDEEMLDGLRAILVEHGTVSATLIDESSLPPAKSYVFRFNTLVAAMEAAGVSGPSLPPTIITRFRLRCLTADMLAEIERCANLAGVDHALLGRRTFRFGAVTARFLCTRCRYERSHPCWKVLLRHKPPVDFIVWARMDEANRQIAGIYLLPVTAFPEHTVLWPSTRTLASYECFAYPSIAHLFGVATLMAI